MHGGEGVGRGELSPEGRGEEEEGENREKGFNHLRVL